MPMTPQEMLEKMVATIHDQTGKSWEEWVSIARKAGIDKHKALTNHMKTEHGLNHNQAQWLAWAVTDPGRLESYDRPDDLVDALYSGKKEHLRPIHDRLMELGGGLGPVRPNVCRTYTSLAGRRQFAMINPRTQSQVDLELAMPAGAEAGGRLEAYKSSNPNFTHRIRIGTVDEIDDEVIAALRAAYEPVQG